jgi:hypothetical protein
MTTSLPSGWELFNESYTAAWPFRDVEGRPIGEGSAPDECLASIRTEWRVCPYTGSRHHHTRQMNLTALRQVTSTWQQILAGTRWLKREYMVRLERESFDAVDLWRMTKFATTLPAYLRSRPDQPVADGELPVVVSAMYKVLAGVFQTVQHRRLLSLATGDSTSQPISADELACHAETHGLFIGRTGVCAGPPHLIAKILNTVIEPPVGHEDTLIADIIGEPERFFRYAAADSTLQMRKFTVQIALQSILFRLRHRIACDAPGELIAALQNGLSQMRESSFLPIPDELLSDAGTGPREAVVRGVLEDVGELDRWLAGRALRPLPPSIAKRAGEITASAVIPSLSAPTRAALGETLAAYLDAEHQFLPELCARQILIDRILERSSDCWLSDQGRVRASLGITPSQVLASWLTDPASAVP